MRQRQLDGVRGVAILMVIADHHDLFPAGWTGVDLFFVLSGFLITRILLQSKGEKHYWSQFYIKRAGRIFPPLMILLPLAFALSRHIKVVGLIGYALFLGNYLNLTRYSAAVLVILWSLAIEEHFYLLWPFAIRYLSNRRSIFLLITILLLEPLIRLAATGRVGSYEPIYYLTWFRLDSIAAGSLLALLAGYPRLSNRLQYWSLLLFEISAATFILISLAYGSEFTTLADSALFNSLGYSLSAASSFFLIAHLVGRSGSWVSSLFSLQPLAFIGRISYGMYLFHPIILAITRRIFRVEVGPSSIDSTRCLFWIDLLLVIVLSWVSFKVFETPMIEWSRRIAARLDNSPRQVRENPSTE